MSSQYTHRPLSAQQIRLVDLEPGQPRDGISISIRHEDFTSPSSVFYDALSYTWGSPATTNYGLVMIRNDIDGNGNQYQAVGESLFTALQHLRCETSKRTLWMDAICINQQDDAEKSLQVALMGDIYRFARKVICWLGPEADDSGTAMRLLDQIGRLTKVDWSTRNIWYAAPLDDDKEAENAVHVPSLTKTELFAMRSLVLRPWFERLWIRQEIGLANAAMATLQCGTWEIPWSNFEKAIWYLYSYDSLNSSAANPKEMTMLSAALKVVINLGRESRPGAAPGSLLAASRSAKCGDPRDRIYANLSMMEEHARAALLIQPDYFSSVTQVYYTFAARYLLVFGRQLLKYCVAPTLIPSLPSWVPDWTNRTSLTLFPTLSSGFMTDHFMLSSERSLPCNGKMCGILSQRLSSFNDILTRHMDDETLAAELNKLCEALPARYGSSTRRKQSLWEVMGAMDFRERRVPPRGYNLSLERCTKRSTTVPADEQYGSSTLQACIRVYGINRQLFLTESGHLGLVPESAQAEDEVWDILGTGCLLILRQVSPAKYHIIGAAWLDGFCNNEALLGRLPDGYESVRLRLEGQQESVPAIRNLCTGEVTRVDPRLRKIFEASSESAADAVGNGILTMEMVTPDILRKAGTALKRIELI